MSTGRVLTAISLARDSIPSLFPADTESRTRATRRCSRCQTLTTTESRPIAAPSSAPRSVGLTCATSVDSGRGALAHAARRAAQAANLAVRMVNPQSYDASGTRRGRQWQPAVSPRRRATTSSRSADGCTCADRPARCDGRRWYRAAPGCRARCRSRSSVRVPRGDQWPGRCGRNRCSLGQPRA